MQTLTQTTANACGCVWNTTTARKTTSCTRHLAIDALRAAQELLGRLHNETLNTARPNAQYEIDCLKQDVGDVNRALFNIASIIRRMPPAAGG